MGRLGRPHGLRGEVTIEVRTDEPDRRFANGALLRAEPPRGSASPLRALHVAGSRWHSGTLLVRFDELPDRNAAEAARGILLFATVDDAEAPEDPDEFYAHQLVVRREALVPFVKALVPEVDLAGGRVVVADRPGLITPLEESDR